MSGDIPINRGLFNPDDLSDHLRTLKIDNLKEKHEIIQKWAYSLSTGKLESTTEQSAKGAFLRDIFTRILGYDDFVGKDHWMIEVEKRTDLDSKRPDALLGSFSNSGAPLVSCAVEVKGAAIRLDEKKKGINRESPVDQAFKYPKNFEHCKWVILTNFTETRLYRNGSAMNYESFLLKELATDLPLFEKFCFILSEETLTYLEPGEMDSVIDEIYKSNIKEKLGEAIRRTRNELLPLDTARRELEELPSSALRKIKASNEILGDFIDIGYGLHIKEKKLSEFWTSSDQEGYFKGKNVPFRSVGKVYYLDKRLIEGAYHSDETFFKGKRVMINRFGAKIRHLEAVFVASLAEEDYWSGRDFLNIKVTDSRLTPEFVVGLLNSYVIKIWRSDQIGTRAASDVSQVVSSDIRKIPLVLPTNEQLADITDKVQWRKQLEDEYLKEVVGIAHSLPYTNEFEGVKNRIQNYGIPHFFLLRGYVFRQMKNSSRNDKEIAMDFLKEVSRHNKRYYKMFDKLHTEIEQFYFQLYGLEKMQRALMKI